MKVGSLEMMAPGTERVQLKKLGDALVLQKRDLMDLLKKHHGDPQVKVAGEKGRRKSMRVGRNKRKVQKNQETDGREVVLPQKEILTDVHLQTGIWIDVIHWTEIWTSALPQKTDSEMIGHHMMTGVMIGSEMTDVPLLMTDLTDVHPQMTVSEKTEDLLVVAGEIEKETETEMGQPLEMTEEMREIGCHHEMKEGVGVIVVLLVMTDHQQGIPGVTEKGVEIEGLITEIYGWIKKRWVG